MKYLGLWLAAVLSSQGVWAMQTERAIFAGGCFWCMEAEFEQADGVQSVTSGYIGGHVKNPTYEQVGSKQTGHAEAVEIVYDPQKISYGKLLEIYWGNIDPTDAGGQFYDRGNQYRTAIFYLNDAQRQAAETSKMKMEAKLGQKLATEIVAATEFYPAETYHQDYYKKNPMDYMAYKKGSGREKTLKKVWGD